jgi:hypothetical protein
MTTKLTVSQARADVAALEERLTAAEIAKLESLHPSLRDDYPGHDLFAQVISIERRDATCSCGQRVDAWDSRKRLLVGCNTGTVVFTSHYRCPACRTSGSSTYQRVP